MPSEKDLNIIKNTSLRFASPTGASLPETSCVMVRLMVGYSITNYDGKKGFITIELIA